MKLNQHLSQRSERVKPSLIRSFDVQLQDIDDLVFMTIGQPDFKTQDSVKEAAKEALDQNITGYTPSNGYPELRTSFSQFMSRHYNLNYDPDTEIITTTGATEAIAASMLAILNPGDKILIPQPTFSLYEMAADLCEAEIVYVDTTENNYLLDANLIEKTLEEHPDIKAIVLNYPSNPTGRVLSQAQTEGITDLLRDKPIFIISDEVYSEFVFDQDHISPASSLRDQTIIIQAVSKSHAMTGWRCGFICAPSELVEGIEKMHQTLVTNITSFVQVGAKEALDNGDAYIQEMKAEYMARRDYLMAALSEAGFKMAKPDGAFYIFAKIPEGQNQNSIEFCLELAHEAKVAVTPGIAFGPSGEGHIRLSYATDREIIKTACHRIKDYIIS